MKICNKIFLGLASSLLLFTACSDFEDININPNAVGEENVQVGHLLNKSIIEAQQNPHISERMFILIWKRAARFDRASGFTLGADNDSWNTDYFSTGYGVGWLNYVNQAINLGEKRASLPGVAEYEANILQMSRIWRAYMLTELADNFGPIPMLNKYDGTVSPYESVESIYDFVLAELTDAVAKIDQGIDMSPVQGADNVIDPFYNSKMEMWIKYANSLRLRCAMRLSVVDPGKAKKEFEAAAATGQYITTLTETAQVAEKSGWNALTGVMSRPWSPQPLSVTMNNLMIGLGGVDFQVPAKIASEVKVKDAMQYLGVRYDKHFPTTTNDPAAGYFFDALPEKIDPRATVLYNIPGFDDGSVYSSNISLIDTATLLDPNDPQKRFKTLDVAYTWNTWVAGKWDKKGNLSSELTGASGTYPSLSKVYRGDTNKRVWFGPWETYFLLAEAATYGWAVSGTAKSNYEAGISVNFEYHGVSQFLGDYLSSKDYNRIGTSVAFDHKTEAVSHEISYVDGYTNAEKTAMYTYPKNSIYQNGAYNNDALTKIITQKYLAQNPWLPLEAWSDHRRLGLPFFENQAVEIDYNPTAYEVPLTSSTSKESRLDFYPKRLRYPSIMETNNKTSFDAAMTLLGGDNSTLNTLWWSKKSN